MTAEIDWMGGAVPPSWQVYKLKYVLREEHKSVGEDLPAGAISFGEVVYKDFDNEETLATYRTVRRGQFLINPLNLNYDLKSLRIGLSEIDCRVSPAYIVASADESISNASYLRWALRVFDVQHIKTLGAGVRQTVKFEDIGACRIALPSLDQQEVIASRLSSETSRIDTLVAKKTRFIELLREKRQALITQAVTKGLDPSVPMKDSGVEWMGDRVPADWPVYKLKRVLREECKLIGANWSAGAISYGEVVYKDFDNEETLSTYRSVRRGQFLINPLNLNYDLKSLRIALSDIDCRVSPAYIVAVNEGRIALARYLRWALRVFDVQHIKSLGAGVRQTVKFEDIGACRIALPSLDLQEKIAALLDRETERIDRLVEKTERSIELLREHRTALITAAVTGKIDLRDAA